MRGKTAGEEVRAPSSITGFIVGCLSCLLLFVAGLAVSSLWLWWAVKRRGAETGLMTLAVVWGSAVGLAVELTLRLWLEL